MSVYERVRAVGEWSLRFLPSTPIGVREEATAFSHIVITKTRAQPGNFTDAQLLGLSLYTGVIRRPGGTQLEIGGPGAGMWLGDEDGKGQILTSQTYYASGTIGTWVGALRPSSLAAGSTESISGTMEGAFQWCTNRVALDWVCDRFGAEWVVRPDLTLDVGTVNTLYGTTPEVIAMPGTGGSRDGTLVGVGAEFDVVTDYDDWISKVYLSTDAGVVTSGSASGFYDGQGNAITWSAFQQWSGASIGSSSDLADAIVERTYTEARQVTAQTTAYAITADCPVGSNLWAYDPDSGLVDTANRVVFDGADRFPVALRLYGARWPIENGMGVYVRQKGSGTTTWVDLTPWIDWEPPGAELEIGWPARVTSDGIFVGKDPLGATHPSSPWTAYTPTWTCNSGTNPSIGNGTLTGYYSRVGTTGSIQIQVTGGSTTTWGTGSFYYWSLPSGWTAKTGVAQVGSAQVLDAGVNRVAASAIVQSADTKVFILYGDTEVGPTYPIASPGTSDEFTITATFELDP